MAKKLNQQDLLKLTSIDTPPTDSVAFAAKSDGLYQKVGTTESKLSTTAELLDRVKTPVPLNAKFTDTNTVYTHPTSAGNKHIPTGGASNQILRYSASGTAVWSAENNTTYGIVTTAANGLMIAADKSKLDGIASNANNYSLPTASATVLGGIKVGSRLTISSGVLSANVQSDNNFTSAYKTKLDGIATGANNYIHPSAHPISFITGLQGALDSKATPVDISTAINGIEIGGRNLFIESAVHTGRYLQDTGEITILASWSITDYIPVESGKQYIASGYSNLGIAPSTVFYNANKEYISGIRNGSASGPIENDQRRLVTTPSGSYYMRFSFIQVDLGSLKIEKGNKATDWTPALEEQVTINTAQTITGVKTFTGTVTAPTFIGALSGNASTATTLATARTIGGVSFNGSANINLPGVNTAGNQNTSGNATTATTATNCSRSVVAGNGLSGGGALTANRTLTLGTPSTLTNATTNAVTTASHTHAITTTTVGAVNSIVATDASGGVRGNIIRIGGAWTLELSGTELVFKYNNVIKQRMLSDGTILGTGGITALSTE